jgi:hypothetical protein
MGAALEAAVAVEEAGDESGSRVAACRASAASEPSTSSQSGLSSVVGGVLEPGVARRAESRVPVEHAHVGAMGARDRGAVVARAAVDDDELRRVGAEVALDRGDERLRAESWMTTTAVKLIGRAARSSTACIACAARRQS